MSQSLENVARALCLDRGMEFACKVGEGASKQTFKVIAQDGTPFALKLFMPGTPPERSQREFAAMIMCNHPNIAKLHSVGYFKHDGQTILTALEEFLAGGVLSPPITLQQCLSYGSQLIDAVGHLARLKLVHRDIKPDNVIFRPDGETPVIVDFGIVRDLAEISATPTWLNQGPCTPLFASPEQLNNEKNLIDWRADQFALGAMFSVLYIGGHPYSMPQDSSPWDAISRVAARELPPAALVFRPGNKLPLVAKMVSPWPVRRFRTPEDLASAWKEQLEDV